MYTEPLRDFVEVEVMDVMVLDDILIKWDVRKSGL